MVANSRDHFPPATLTMKGLLLPCCIECNTLAGTDYGNDFFCRAELVKFKLMKKHHKALNVPPWNLDELGEMGDLMKKEIEIWQKRRRVIQSRLAWNAGDYLTSIDKNNAFAKLLAECGITTECGQKRTKIQK